MSDPVKHHYVPEVYLKSFADSKKQLFQLRRKYKKIAIKSIGQVCYEKNYFKFQRKEALQINNVDDFLYIEKKVFAKLENNYSAFLNDIVYPSLNSFPMPRKSIESFLKTLFNIKRRNPSLRKVHSDSLRGYLNSDKFLKDAAQAIEISRRIDKIDPLKFIENYLHEVNTDETRLYDGYLSRFLEDGDELQNSVVETLMTYDILIFHSPIGHQFLTSDNPGFVLNGTDILNFGGFGFEFVYIFPLTPHCLLAINKKRPDNSLTLSKLIYPLYIDAATVDYMNECTLQVANDKVFSYSNTPLEKIITNHVWY
jgi:hypothetical protein